MHSRIWSVLLALSLSFCLVILAYLSKRPICINSNFVYKVDIIDSDRFASAYSCGFNKSVPFSTFLEDWVKRVQEKIQPIEEYLGQFGPLSSRVQIVIHNAKNKFEWVGNLVSVNATILNQKSILERVILKVWLRERIHWSLFERSVAEETLVDLLMTSFNGSFQSDKKTNLIQRWPIVLKDPTSYCREQSWVMLDDLDLCSRLTLRLRDQNDEGFQAHSVRALSSEVLIHAWKKLNYHEKNQLIRDLANSNFEFPTQDPNYSQYIERLDSEGLTQAAFEIEKLSSVLFSLGSKSASWQKMATEFQSTMVSRGYSHEIGGAVLDVVFLIPKFESTENYQQWLKYFNFLSHHHSQLMIGVLSNDNLWVLPTDRPIKRSLFATIKAHRGISINCQIPVVEQLVSLSKSFEKMLFIHDCKKASDLRFSGFLDGGIDSFARDNHDISFVQIHLPSLLQAWKSEQVNPLTLLSQRKWQNPFFANLGWRDPDYDEKLKVYRAKSVIEAIEAYRF